MACSAANAIVPPLGLIAKIDGQYPSSESGATDAGTLIKQFSTYYIAVAYFGEKSKPSTSCSDKDIPAALNEATSELRRDLEKAISTVKEL